MTSTAVFYGSDTGNTEAVAKQIAEKLQADIYDVSTNPKDKLGAYKNLILGTSTMGLGDLQDDWASFISELEQADLSEKTVALFGLGDAEMYTDTFVDGMGEIYNSIKDKGCKIVGQVAASNYEFDDSSAVVDGSFVGLPLDEDNQSDLTEERLGAWIESIKGELG